MQFLRRRVEKSGNTSKQAASPEASELKWCHNVVDAAKASSGANIHRKTREGSKERATPRATEDPDQREKESSGPQRKCDGERHHNQRRAISSQGQIEIGGIAAVPASDGPLWEVAQPSAKINCHNGLKRL